MKEDHETRIIGLEKELNDARREAAISDGDRIEMHARSKATKRRLSICLYWLSISRVHTLSEPNLGYTRHYMRIRCLLLQTASYNVYSFKQLNGCKKRSSQ